MIVGIGTDLVSIARIKTMLDRFGERLVNRILSIDEQVLYRECLFPETFMAKRFAAKEAVAKALGTGIGAIAFNEISVTNLPSGQPMVTLLGKAEKFAKNKNIFISLSDEAEQALAFVVISSSSVIASS
ncbi:MAG: holo-ACP synthase [Candidatus Berkiellales bacterium]